VTFHGLLKPVSEAFVAAALTVSGLTREQTLAFPEPRAVMEDFARWIAAHSTGRPMFVSDNNGFDWRFINWYFHELTGNNPFGHSSTNLAPRAARERLLRLVGRTARVCVVVCSPPPGAHLIWQRSPGRSLPNQVPPRSHNTRRGATEKSRRIDGTPPAPTTRVARSCHLGWPSPGRWPQAGRRPTGAATSTSPRT
jgi:hypothetical protein